MIFYLLAAIVLITGIAVALTVWALRDRQHEALFRAEDATPVGLPCTRPGSYFGENPLEAHHERHERIHLSGPGGHTAPQACGPDRAAGDLPGPETGEYPTEGVITSRAGEPPLTDVLAVLPARVVLALSVASATETATDPGGAHAAPIPWLHELENCPLDQAAAVIERQLAELEAGTSMTCPATREAASA